MNLEPDPLHQPLTLPTHLFIITAVVVALLLTIIGLLLYQNSLLKQQVQSSSPIPTIVYASPSPTTTDPTANWKTYVDSQIGYTIKYPLEMLPSRGNCDSFIFPDTPQEKEKIISIREKGIEIAYTIKGLELGFCAMSNPDKSGLADFAKQHTPNITFLPVNINGYEGVRGDSSNFSEFFIYNPTNKIIRIWYRYGNTRYVPIANQILSTFKFLDQPVSTPPPKTVVRPPLADTSTWQTVSLANISFKIPADYIFSIDDSTAIASGHFKQKDAQFGSSGYISVDKYDGGSRRVWYQKQLNASDSEIQKYTKIQEVQLGNVSTLDFFMDGGWWQGGYGSPIIISSGKNIVTITGGRNYRPETGEITRWIVTDTIASTVLFK